LRKASCIAVLVVCFVLLAGNSPGRWPGFFTGPVNAQEPDLVAQWLSTVNQARLDAGLAPYSLQSKLSVAAQRHADDVKNNGFANPGDVHQGSDGTHEQERVAQAGYGAWTWLSGDLIVDENMWSGHGTIEDAMAFFVSSTPHYNNIFSPRYREIGIGVATNGEGAYYFVLVFGVRPNVLPIYINDGAVSTDNPQVVIRLTNEEARPDGEGTDKMGRAVEVRVSDAWDWDGQEWQPWSEYVPWTLPEVAGEHTVYVQFRDAAGRVAESVDTIILEQGDLPTPTQTAVPPSATPEPTATAVPPTPEPTATPEPTPTPEPTNTVTPEPPPTVSLTATPFVPTPSPALGPTPFPTWTPLPTMASPTEPGERSISGWLALAAALQGLVVILGISFILRRGPGAGHADSLDVTR
jgi:uncharacterized protein YkwD